MAKDVIIACDFSSGEETLAFLDKFTESKPYVKIGMELFYAAGPDMVRRLKDRGHAVFLDLKLHDIPNTVGKAMSVLSHLGADMVNLHAAGGSAMMEYAMEGLCSGGGQRPLLIAVTQLTSTSQERMERELLISRPLEEVVVSYAQTAKGAGRDGVGWSPLEAGTSNAACGSEFITVTPGVRFAGAAGDDQQRITTPAKARELGSDYIVVGRPITQAADPVAAYVQCMNEFLGKC